MGAVPPRAPKPALFASMQPLKNLLVDRLGQRDDAFGWRERQAALDPSGLRSVLLLHTDAKLGDAIVNSLLVDALGRRLPHLEVAFGTSRAFADYWRSHPNVKEAIVLPDRIGGNPFKRLADSRRAVAPWQGRFDLAICFDQFAMLDTFALLDGLKAKRVVGFNKHPYRLFDHSLEEHRYGVQARHISSRVSSTMAALGVAVDPFDLDFHVPFGEADDQEADAVLARGGAGPRLLFNVYGAGAEKRMSPEAVGKALASLGPAGTVFLSVPKGEEEAYRSDDPRVVVISALSGFPALFALTSKMDFVVSPDSAVGHIAAAFGLPQIAVFADAVNIPVVWKPMNPRCEVVVSAEGSAGALDWSAFAAAAHRMFASSPERVL